MRQARAPFTRADFTLMLLEQFPEVREDVEFHQGLLHLEMMEFVLLTPRAIDEADWPLLKRCVHLAHELWERADPDLKNALNVSYLEHLKFSGSNGKQAWSRFTRELQKAWQDMQAYWEELARRTGNRGNRPRPA